jgi:hypothetical protein
MLALAATAGCSRQSDWRNPAVSQAAEGTAEAAYLVPPSVTAAARAAGKAISLQGMAEPNARVRLGAPTGAEKFATADAKGVWRVDLPDDADQVQLYGLSMIVRGRTVQSEGYVAVVPGGEVVRLRAGAGALPLAKPAGRLKILAVDYDRDGGAMVSGVATPDADLLLRIDGVESQGHSDAQGRFSIAASQPLTPQAHQVLVGGDGEDTASVDASKAEPLAKAAMRAQRTAFGWRIDWITPGGGVQTTLIPAA